MRFSRVLHVAFWGIGKVSVLLGRPGPLHWLTITGREPGRQRSILVGLYPIDGRTYVIDLHPFNGLSIDVRPFRWRPRELPRTGWASDARASGRGTLTVGSTDTDVTLTEVSDPAVKRQVLTVGVTKDIDGGLAVATSRFAVFEVASASPQPTTSRDR